MYRGIAITVTLLFLVWLNFPPQNEEPRFAGKTMNQWLVEIGKSSAQEQYVVAAAIGPALVPYISHTALRPESWWSRNYDKLWRTIPSALQSRIPRRISAPVPLREARNLLRFYGPAATNAVPILMEALERSDHRVRTNAIAALGELGETAAPAIPAIESAMKSDSRLTSCALEALLKIPPKPKPATRPLSDVALTLRPPRPIQNHGLDPDAIAPYVFRQETYQGMSAPVSTKPLSVGDLTLEPKPGPGYTIFFQTAPISAPVKRPGK